MYKNSQFAVLLAPHQKHSCNTGIARKYEYSTVPEERQKDSAATTKVQLMPHDGIASYLTPTSTERGDKKNLNRKQYTQYSYKATLTLESDIPEKIMSRRKQAYNGSVKCHFSR